MQKLKGFTGIFTISLHLQEKMPLSASQLRKQKKDGVLTLNHGALATNFSNY
jgi:hypothetical protein